MPARVALLALTCLGLTVTSLQACSPVSSCTAANCGGCCDTTGRCVPGTATASCGKDGVACVACPMPAQCLSNVCTVVATGGGSGGSGGGMGSAGGVAGGGGAAGGSAGGSTGGGAAGGTGGGSAGGAGGGLPNANCQVVNNFEALMAAGTYRPMNSTNQQAWAAGFTAQISPGSTLYLRGEVQLYRPPGAPPAFPISGTIAANTTFRTCDECFQLAVACDATGGNCLGDLIAVAGSYTFTAGTTNSFRGMASNLRFVPWDLANDRPSTAMNMRCIDVLQMTWAATW